MIVLDANILLYAYNSDSPFYDKARKHLEALLSNPEPVGIPIQCIYAFLRLLTNPIVSGRQISVKDATATVDEWLVQPHVSVLYPGERHWEILKRLAVQGHALGNLISDAAIAATAIEYGGVIHTNDRDFARFPGVRWLNPIQP